MGADWVSVKVDAGDSAIWEKVNRPVAGLSFETYINGIMSFSREISKSLRTETMLCGGVNDTEDNLAKVVSLVKMLGPGKAYISVPIRPPAEANVQPPDSEHVNLAWQLFSGEGMTTELLIGFEGIDTGFTGNSYEDILNITAVHPLREDTMRELLEKNGSGYSVVQSLLDQGLIRSLNYQGNKFYIRVFQQ